MRRAPRVVLLALLVALAVTPAAGRPAPAPRAAAAPRAATIARAGADACAGCLRAGAATVELDVPDGTPLGGYGAASRRLLVPDLFGRFSHAFWLRPHEGRLDPLRAHALVLERGGTRVLWGALDLIAIDRAFTADVRRRLQESGVPDGTLILSASHTHSGPGAFLDVGLLGAISVDRFDPVVRDALAAQVVEALRRADTARVPARVGVARVDAPADLTSGRLGEPVDQEIVVLKLAARSGRPLALLWNYAIHGTMLGPSNLRLSADVTGAASAAIERAVGVPALFVNGAVGDVSPARHGLAELPGVARALAAAVQEGWARADADDDATLAVRTTVVPLPAARLSLHNCLASWLPRRLSLPLARLLPRDAELTAVALGPVVWVTMPGELQSRLGRAVKDAARAGGREGFVAGVSNDYLGYFVTADAYDRSTYVSCATLYGAEAGETLTRAAVDLVRELPR